MVTESPDTAKGRFLLLMQIVNWVQPANNFAQFCLFTAYAEIKHGRLTMAELVEAFLLRMQRSNRSILCGQWQSP